MFVIGGSKKKTVVKARDHVGALVITLPPREGGRTVRETVLAPFGAVVRVAELPEGPLLKIEGIGVNAAVSLYNAEEAAELAALLDKAAKRRKSDGRWFAVRWGILLAGVGIVIGIQVGGMIQQAGQQAGMLGAALANAALNSNQVEVVPPPLPPLGALQPGDHNARPARPAPPGVPGAAAPNAPPPGLFPAPAAAPAPGQHGAMPGGPGAAAPPPGLFPPGAAAPPPAVRPLPGAPPSPQNAPPPGLFPAN